MTTWLRTYCILGLLFVCLLVFSGCAPKHSIQVADDSITVYCEYPDAKKVVFASSTDRFQLHQATQVKGDVWVVTVPRTKEFTYFYMVDGVVTLPDCRYTVMDDFGGKNCFFSEEM